MRYHRIRDALEDKLLEIVRLHTDDNGSDMLSKALASEKLMIYCMIVKMENSSS